MLEACKLWKSKRSCSEREGRLMSTQKFGLLIDAKVKGANNIKRLGNSMQGAQGKVKNLTMAVRGLSGALRR